MTTTKPKPDEAAAAETEPESPEVAPSYAELKAGLDANHEATVWLNRCEELLAEEQGVNDNVKLKLKNASTAEEKTLYRELKDASVSKLDRLENLLDGAKVEQSKSQEVAVKLADSLGITNKVVEESTTWEAYAKTVEFENPRELANYNNVWTGGDSLLKGDVALIPETYVPVPASEQPEVLNGRPTDYQR